MDKKPRRIARVEFQPTEGVQAFWTAQPPAGTVPEDLLNPEYWTHVARFIEPLTEIRAVPQDGAWYARYLVLYADRMSAKLVVLEHHALDEVEVAPEGDAPFYVKFVSPNSNVLWCVLRKSDDVRVASGFKTRKGAADECDRLLMRQAA